jgi:lipopolysaccharide/colanic/teichoic acid biosynthesis glycosyltransferase
MRFRVTLLQFVACAASVGFCAWLYDLVTGNKLDTWPEWWALPMGALVVTCWLAIAFRGGGDRELRTWFDRFFTAVGFMLLVEYGLAYLFYLKPLPWAILLSGSALAVTITTLLVTPQNSHASRGILLLGFDSTSRALALVLRQRIVGILDDEPACVVSDLPFLGGIDRLSEAVAEKQPGCVIVSDGDRRPSVKPRQLLRLRYAGIAVEPGSAFYESAFSRVNTNALDPFQLLFSSAFMASRTAMAVQAVYTNAIALGLLLLFSPVLLLIAILISISSGGPALERIECPGFQQIPFRLLRFRTRGLHGEKLWIGDVISRLGLANLPHLINVARGEMTLVGPPPVRTEFARRLVSLIPVYGHRFTVRPGILGWSQVNLRNVPLPDERLRLEYDLYYVKQGSPSMDLDIFFRTLFRISMAPELNRAPGTF